MSRDYKNLKKKKTNSLISRCSNVLSFVTGLALGLAVAVILYFQQYGTTVETNNILLQEDEQKLMSTMNTAGDKKVFQLPEPKFDFYKILPNKEVNISEWESGAEETTSVKSEKQPAVFVLQVGSFKEFQQADAIKARLALIGVTANIQRVVINGQDIRHRVRVGPYKDSTQLQQMKDHLLANDINFMLLTLQIEDI